MAGVSVMTTGLCPTAQRIGRARMALFALVVGFQVAVCQSARADEGARLVVAGVSIVDARDASVGEPRDIIIEGDRVVAVTDPGEFPRRDGDSLVDARGLYAIAGLIDVHAHVSDGGRHAQTPEDRDRAMEQFLRYGVTTIFVPGGGGGNDDQLARWKQRRASGELACPEVYGSGALITARGSHPIGTLWDMPDDVDAATVYARGAQIVHPGTHIDSLIDWKASTGVDGIKIVIEDGPEPWFPKPRLSDALVSDLVEASHARGLDVFAHVSMPEHVAAGVRAGVDGVMHSAEGKIPDEVLARMAADGVFYVATLSLYDGFFNESRGSFEESDYALAGVSARALESLTEAARGTADANEDTTWIAPVEEALAHNLRAARDRGVPLALGTDTGNPTVFPGYAVHEELALLVEYGLTPGEALLAATEGAASFLGLEDTLGRIAPGLEADLLLLARNPLEDIVHSRTVRAVITDGEVRRNVVSVVKN